MRQLLLVYALLNAVLYSTLLPLWEGFDEPFHFGYVQQIATGGGFPDARTATLSREVATSLTLVPGSESVKRNLPIVTAYGEYFSLPAEQKHELNRLSEMPSDFRRQSSGMPNYQAQHAPLAYVLMAIPERLFANMALPNRVLALRLLIATVGSLLLCAGMNWLGALLGVPELYKWISIFCLLSSQMTWATIAHVANDWLALAIAVWALACLIRYAAQPDVKSAVAASMLFAAGLLTKAYFLPLAPLVPAVMLARRRPRHALLSTLLVVTVAGPWYARNVSRYGVLTGMQEARAGTGPAQVLQAAHQVDWVSVIPTAARAALWTGNNTFRSFSIRTVNAVLIVCLVGLTLWSLSRHSYAEWLTAAYCFVFLTALAYSTIMTTVTTGKAGAGTSAWYAQIVVAPALVLIVLGLSRWESLGRATAAVLVLLFGYLLTATYFLKLIPLYGGFEGRSSLDAIQTLYSTGLPALLKNLDDVALGPARFILSMAALIVVLTLILQIALIRSLFTRPAGVESAHATR